MQLGRTVGELLKSMSALEYAHWAALSIMEPIGPERGDWQAAQIVATLANVNRDSKTTPTPYRARDFLLWADPVEMSEDEISERLFAAFPVKD